MPDTVTEQPRPPTFVLLARAPAGDPDILRRRWDTWHQQAAASSAHWLGSTGGLAPGGDWLAAVRYSSEEAARTAAQAAADPDLLPDATTIEVTSDVHLVEGNGSPADGTFVQFMRARVHERHRLEAVEDSVGDRFAAHRPDFLAGLRAWTGPDRLTVVDWFTSEADARAGEAIDIPADLGTLFSEWMSLLHDVEWYDLRQPWQMSPEPAS